MQIHSTFINYESQLHWTARIMIRACLLLSLWNLPLPWIHNHSSYNAAETAIGSLPVHLEQFHQGKQAPQEGWHLHFVYLGAEHSSDPLKQKFPPQHYFIMGESSSSLPAGHSLYSGSPEQFLALTASGNSTSQLRIMLPGSPNQNNDSPGLPHFLNGSIRDLTSVSRC